MNTNSAQNRDSDRTYLHDFFGILQKRWWTIALCLTVVLIPVIYYNKTATRVYEASTTIIYEEPQTTINLMDQRYRSPMKETLVNQIQEIKSRSVAMEVAKELPKEVLEKLPLPENPPPDFDEQSYYAAIVRSHTSAAPLAESDIIQIRVTAERHPYVAMSIANTLCDVLQKRNLRLRSEEAGGVRSFIEEQMRKYKQRLEEAETALRQFKVNNRVTSLDKEVEEQLKIAGSVELRYQEAKSERQKTEESLQRINQKIAAKQETLAPSVADVSTNRIEQLKSQLNTLHSSYINLQLQGVSKENSKMRDLQSSINSVREKLAKEATRFAEAEDVIDPVSQMANLYERKVNLELELQMYRSQEQSLKRALEEYESSLSRLPQKEFTLAKLQRERDLANELYMMLSKRREEARIKQAEKIGNMRIIDRATLPKSPIQPRSMLNLVIAIMLGTTIGLGLAFFMETMDTTIKSAEEVERKIKLNVLGTIPLLRSSKLNDKTEIRRGYPNGLVTHTMPSSPAAESYRTLRTNLQFYGNAKGLHVVMLTSTGPQEGKSTTSANLAVTAAQMGLKTLLIDGDLRRPTVHRIFNLNRDPGVAEILLSHQKHEENGDSTETTDEQHTYGESYTNPQTSIHARAAVQKMVSMDLSLSAAVHKTKVNHLDVLTCGTIPPNPAELLATEKMKDLLTIVREKYDFVVIDAPPMIAVTDAAILAPMVDGTLLVIESGRNEKHILDKAISMLDHVGINLLGAVLNRVRIKQLYGGYDYYYTYYAVEGKSDKQRKSKFKGNENTPG